jgi:hypothetical protein
MTSSPLTPSARSGQMMRSQRHRRSVLPRRSQTTGLHRACRRSSLRARRPVRRRLVPALPGLAHRHDDHVPMPRLRIRRHHWHGDQRSSAPAAQRLRSRWSKAAFASERDLLRRATTLLRIFDVAGPRPVTAGWRARCRTSAACAGRPRSGSVRRRDSPRSTPGNRSDPRFHVASPSRRVADMVDMPA